LSEPTLDEIKTIEEVDAVAAVDVLDAVKTLPSRRGRPRGFDGLTLDMRLGFESLRAHKLRALLTMLGIIFGVAAVIAMLSIGAGARQEVIAFIEQLGVRNLIVESRESQDPQALTKIRQLSAGLSFQDLRAIESSIQGLSTTSARKRITPTKMLPKPQNDPPTVFGVSPSYPAIMNLHLSEGRFFTDAEAEAAAPVAVLGQAVRAALFTGREAIGQFVKINQQWFEVIGVAGPQLSSQPGNVTGMATQDGNQVIYVPLMATLTRIEDAQSNRRDEIDGLYLQLDPSVDVSAAGSQVRALLDVMHRGAPDVNVIVPAELLAQQERTRNIFQVIMVAIASISMLVGGIGIMNIMLASVLERTREIGVRRAIGARKSDIVRQFLVETTMITLTGGLVGTAVGVALSQLVGYFAGWSTIVTMTSIVLAFGVSVTVGIVFGLYPAVRAASLDPVLALHSD
jgi:putative ABC transport system permease protein